MTSERPLEPPALCKDMATAIGWLQNVLRLNSDTDYQTVLLWAVHTYMKECLPSSICLYLAFDGAKSSGKTTATRASIKLAKNGLMITSITPSALKRLMDQGATIAIDEIDAQTFQNEALATMLRMGNSWDAQARLTEQRQGKFEVIQTNIGGPKVFNFRGEIEEALRSRCIVISMPSCKDTQLIVESLFLDHHLTQVKDWLEYEVGEAMFKLQENAVMSGMTVQEYVEMEMRHKDFLERLDKIEAALGRGVQQAAMLLRDQFDNGMEIGGIYQEDC